MKNVVCLFAFVVAVALFAPLHASAGVSAKPQHAASAAQKAPTDLVSAYVAAQLASSRYSLCRIVLTGAAEKLAQLANAAIAVPTPKDVEWERFLADCYVLRSLFQAEARSMVAARTVAVPTR